MNDVREMRRGPRTSGSWKLSILLLFIGLISFLTLAKNSYNLPQSNPVRRLASASKLCAGRFVSVPSPIAASQGATISDGHDARSEGFVLTALEPPVRSAASLSHPALRSPPSSL
jgi:hypothetical protein